MNSEALTQIVNEIRLLLYGEVGDIVCSHRASLASHPLDYIVPAVWGPSQGGTLSQEQREINKRVQMVVRQTVNLLGIGDLSDAQILALEFLVRELILHRFLCKTKALTRKYAIHNNSDKESVCIVHLSEPAGSA
jgi:hypothetical protein